VINASFIVWSYCTVFTDDNFVNFVNFIFYLIKYANYIQLILLKERLSQYYFIKLIIVTRCIKLNYISISRQMSFLNYVKLSRI